MKTIVACLTHNHWNITRHYLESIENVHDKSIKEFIFVDNCSTDDTVANLERLGKTVIKSPTNSVAVATNIALRYDNQCNVLFVANDHVIPNGIVDDLNYYADLHNIGMLSPFTFLSEHDLLDQDSFYTWDVYHKFCSERKERFAHDDKYEDAAFVLNTFVPGGINQANLKFKERHKDDADCRMGKYWPGIVLHSRETIEKVGEYDEKFIGASFEDTDYQLRCNNAGVRSAITNKCFAFHFGSMTTRKFVYDAEMVRAETLNAEYYNEKWK